jgi:chromosome segregation ATPase
MTIPLAPGEEEQPSPRGEAGEEGAWLAWQIEEDERFPDGGYSTGKEIFLAGLRMGRELERTASAEFRIRRIKQIADLEAKLASANAERQKLSDHANHATDLLNTMALEVAALTSERDSLKKQRDGMRLVLNAAEYLLKVAEENEPEYVAHRRYTYADCQKIFEPISEAISTLETAVEIARAALSSPDAGEQGTKTEKERE